jgi:hypothetical protein
MATKPLAQAEATASAVTLYQPAANFRTSGITMIATNHSASDRTLTIHHDIDGTTYSDVNIIENAVTITAGNSKRFSIPSMDESGGLAIVASAANDIVCTLYGTELSI